MTTLAKELRATRRKLGLTQAQCAKLLDIAPRKLWAWEDGSAKPSLIEQHGLPLLLESIERKLGQKAGAR
jgi:DNA-binding transcriptional regulator YiaG